MATRERVQRPKWHRCGVFRFADWTMPDPDDRELGLALHTARYDLTRLTQSQAYSILAAAEAYCHLAGHVAPNRMVIPQLESVRAAVRANRRNGDSDANDP